MISDQSIERLHRGKAHSIAKQSPVGLFDVLSAEIAGASAFNLSINEPAPFAPLGARLFFKAIEFLALWRVHHG